jgi:hypothetical protein
MIDSKLNNTKKIIKHCLVNDINELWDNIKIGQTWLSKQKWYDHSFFDDIQLKQNSKPYKIGKDKI